MNLVVMEGFMEEILEITGRTLDSVRPTKMIAEGLPVASESAVSAPMEPLLGPVIRTVLPASEEAKSATTSLPVVFLLKEGIMTDGYDD